MEQRGLVRKLFLNLITSLPDTKEAKFLFDMSRLKRLSESFFVNLSKGIIGFDGSSLVFTPQIILLECSPSDEPVLCVKYKALFNALKARAKSRFRCSLPKGLELKEFTNKLLHAMRKDSLLVSEKVLFEGINEGNIGLVGKNIYG